MATLNNGTQTAITTTAVQLLPASSSRRGLVINSVAGTCFIGTVGVTATTGIPLAEGETLAFAEVACPNNPVYAISGSSATVFVTEVNLA